MSDMIIVTFGYEITVAWDRTVAPFYTQFPDDVLPPHPVHVQLH